MARAGPLPWISVLMYRSVLAFSAGILTVGAVPKPPVAVTVALGLAGGGADEPQPARASAVASGSKSAAPMRRMGVLVVFG